MGTCQKSERVSSYYPQIFQGSLVKIFFVISSFENNYTFKPAVGKQPNSTVLGFNSVPTGRHFKGKFRNRNLFETKNAKFWWVPKFSDCHSGHIKYWLKKVSHIVTYYFPHIFYTQVHMFLRPRKKMMTVSTRSKNFSIAEWPHLRLTKRETKLKPQNISSNGSAILRM